MLLDDLCLENGSEGGQGSAARTLYLAARKLAVRAESIAPADATP